MLCTYTNHLIYYNIKLIYKQYIKNLGCEDISELMSKYGSLDMGEIDVAEVMMLFLWML